MSTLERAVEIAAAAHAGQRDKAGQIYLLHPLRVMMMLESVEERIVGVLHDVIEDCEDWDRHRLASEGFPSRLLDALDAVTKKPGEAYMEFVARAGNNPISRAVKLADLRDNSDLSRIANPTAKDYERTKRYERAIRFLEDKTTTR